MPERKRKKSVGLEETPKNPSPWIRRKVKTDSKDFFYNSASLESSWKEPKENWYKAKLIRVGKKNVERTYYFNPYLHQATYARPKEYSEDTESSRDALYPLKIKKKSSKVSGFPCYDPFSANVFWYDPRTGHRSWTKPHGCKHKYSGLTKRKEEVVTSMRNIKIQEVYQRASERIEKLSKRLSKLKEDVLAKEKKIKHLEEQSSKKKKKVNHTSMNLMASAVRMAFTRKGRSVTSSGAQFKSKDFGPIISFLKSIDLFLYLSEEQYSHIALDLHPLHFKAGEIIVNANDDAGNLLLIEDGIVGVFTDKSNVVDFELDKLPMEDNEDSFGQKINQLYAGNYFGAREIMTKEKYKTTYVAITTCFIFSLNQAVFDRVVLNNNSGSTGYEKLVLSRVSAAPPLSVQTMKKTKRSKKILRYMSKTPIIHIRDTIINANDIRKKANKVEVSSLTNYITACSNLIALKVSNRKAKPVSKALLHLSKAFAPILNFEDILTRILTSLRHVFKTNECNLFKIVNLEAQNEVSNENKMKQAAIALVTDCQVKRHELVGLDDGLVATAINHNEIVSVSSLEFRRYIKQRDMMELYNEVQSVLVCPITTSDDQVVGAIRIMRTELYSSFSSEEQRILSAMADQVAIVVQEDLFREEKGIEYAPVVAFPFEKPSVLVTQFVGDSINSSVTRPKEVLLKFSLYNGDQLLCLPWCLQGSSQSPSVSIVNMSHKASFDIDFADLPRTTVLVIEAFAVDLFSQDHRLRKAIKLSMSIRKLMLSFMDENDIPGSPSVKSSKQDKLFFAKHLSSLEQNQLKSFSNDDRKLFMNALLKDGIPLGWTGVSLFDFEQVFNDGRHTLKFIHTDKFDKNDLLFNPLLDSKVKVRRKNTGVISFQLEKPKLNKALKATIKSDGYRVIYTDVIKEKIRAKNVNQKTMQANKEEKLRVILFSDPLKKLNDEEKQLIKKNVDFLLKEPHSLPRLVESIDFSSRDEVTQLYEYLNEWATPDPLVALNLLGPKIVDYKVRSFAVTGLAVMTDQELTTYMLVLVQCLRFERFLDNALACFLITKSIENPWLVGVSFFWTLNTEIEKLVDEAEAGAGIGSEQNQQLIIRYRIYISLYLKHCRNRRELGHQRYVNRKLVECHQNIQKENTTKNIKLRTAAMKKELEKIKFPARFRLPINNLAWCTGVRLDECSVKSSKKMPFQLSFTTELGESRGSVAEHHDDDVVVIFKVGDDLRQDQLTLTAFSVVDSIWKNEGMDMKLSIYRVVATSNVTGFIEVVKQSKTIAAIQIGESKFKGKILGKVRAAYSAMGKNKMVTLFGDKVDNVKDNFVPSCAGYGVLTYTLGIGDRHNDNMMMTDDLKLFHIDFGHFLGNFKKAYGLPRETAPFVLTPQMVKLMQTAHVYNEFKHQFKKAFQILRQPRNVNLLITLFMLMVFSDITELKDEKDILWIRHKLMVDTKDEVAVPEMEVLIASAQAKISTYVNHLTHIVKHRDNY